MSRMKFDHITIDVSHTPRPPLLPVWCSIRCSNSLSNSIVNAISACDSAVGSVARKAIQKPSCRPWHSIRAQQDSSVLPSELSDRSNWSLNVHLSSGPIRSPS
jgi:hypothetical protein